MKTDRKTTRWRVTNRKTGKELVIYASDIQNARMKLLTLPAPSLDDYEFIEAGYITLDGVLMIPEKEVAAFEYFQADRGSRKR